VNHWDLKYLDLCRKVASWSKDPSTKCGAWIVDDEHRPLSFGFNGFPRGVDDRPELYLDREAKYARVEHAEKNALWNCNLRPVGATLYVWSSTGWAVCNECAKGIIQTGIRRVVMPSVFTSPNRSQSQVKVALEMMIQRGLQVTEYFPGLNIPDYTIWGPVTYEDCSCKCTGEDNKH
jgi:dCMP deaminase